jgi:hypothetical protein
MNRLGYITLLFLTMGILTMGIVPITTVVGQARSNSEPTRQVVPDPRLEADETFNLNISEKHFTERDFAASTSVGFGATNQEKMSVQVGVAVRAQTIRVDLRNVTGTVRFRGSIQRILDAIRARQPDRSPP